MKPVVIPPLAMAIAGGLMWGTAELAGGAVSAAPTAMIALSLLIAGLALMVVSAWQFWHARTTIDPTRPHKATALVSDGLFRMSRNPIYLGDALLLAALLLWLGSVWNIVWLLAFVLYIDRVQIRAEEAALSNLFGDEYRAYCARVRRWI